MRPFPYGYYLVEMGNVDTITICAISGHNIDGNLIDKPFGINIISFSYLRNQDLTAN